MAGIWWLASYPKSGNTWLRAFLASLLTGKEEVLDELSFLGIQAVKRFQLDFALGIETSDLSEAMQLELRPLAFRVWAQDSPRDLYCKVHDACIPTPSGQPLFPLDVTRGAVCPVRNPLDVAISLAHFTGVSLDRAIMDLNEPAKRNCSPRDLFHQQSEQWGSWSEHVASWLAAPFPVQVVRYEDLLANPLASFQSIVRFLGLDHDQEAIGRAVAAVSFQKLRKHEEEKGFVEKPKTSAHFFRQGQAGAWRETLSSKQIAAIVEVHGPLMARFGYLP